MFFTCIIYLLEVKIVYLSNTLKITDVVVENLLFVLLCFCIENCSILIADYNNLWAEVS